MDCSDDSFLWTDASCDSSDSSIMTPLKEQDELDESGLDKKIQEELFNNQPIPTKAKKKKRKASEMLDSSPVCNDKSIKKESDSDIEAPKKKKKRKNFESEERLDLSLDTLQADNYLNLRVKEEQLFTEPGPVKKKKKHKKGKQSEFESQDSDSTVTSTFGNGSDINNVDDMLLNNYEKTIVEIDKFEAEETIVQKKKKEKKRKSKNDTSDGDETLHNNLQENISNKNSRKERKRSLETPITTNGVVETDSDFEPPQIHIKPAPEITSLNKAKNKKSETESHNKKILSNQNSTKITDRFKFEDEESVDSATMFNTSSKQLQQFVNMKTNLKVCTSKIQKENMITDDDDVWIFRIPKEVDVNDLKDLNFTMDTKWKIKINGQSYDGVVENHLSQIPLLCYDQSKSQIKNISLMGQVSLRKRIPKAHIPQEACVINNQTNFIPLPETKCRHPLFGIDYKKAIKVPKPIAERLNGNIEEDTSLESFSGKKEKKRKHKKEKKKIEKESEPEIDIEVLQSPNTKKKKGKKKHREMMQDGNTTKSIKFKSTDLEPDSAEVWESEQAITANLFNF